MLSLASELQNMQVNGIQSWIEAFVGCALLVIYQDTG
jgi:hypothetical protein